MHPLFLQYCFTNGAAGLLHFTDRLYFMVTFWLVYGLFVEKFCGEISCKPLISVLYYKRCKKTRMRIFLMVPKPETRTVSEKIKHAEVQNQMEERNMSVISMKQLLEAGVHFGHQTRRWNPKMAPYIYTERNGIYIIDLQKSVGMVDDAYNAVSDIAAEGGTILFVGTKKQAQDAIRTEAERCGMFYVNERWLGGMLTNFKTIQSRVKRLNLGGIKEMKRLPDAIFVVDPKKERICVQEAHTLGIPLIGICDTNCDPEELDYVIPGNDDAIRAVKLIVSKMADAVIEANQGATDEDYYEVEAAEEAAEEAVEAVEE